MTENNQSPKKTEKLAETVVNLGRGWASYGLKMAGMALDQSAKTLGQVAKVVEDLRTQVEKAPKSEAPETAAPDASAQKA